MRRPLQSARLLLADRGWMLGFAMETVGFLIYPAPNSPAYGTRIMTGWSGWSSL
jgi:hypothetical protein